jgi:hypothetical protein
MLVYCHHKDETSIRIDESGFELKRHLSLLKTCTYLETFIVGGFFYGVQYTITRVYFINVEMLAIYLTIK